ncbi:MAG: Zn-ribbon domain-containing OB-fold protein [Candidatus Dadabacteria bacterium]|nr:MAG: Zn-ribbon domain-containing OB-fold protein [Candidatus Dadabacteria bacterium]
MSEGSSQGKPRRLRPVLGKDNGWWWERINAGELTIQRCKQCGTLRHPPRPMCWKCHSLEWDYIVSSGKGKIYSYVVIHRPQFPGYEYPLVVAVIDLEEGTRIVSNVVGVDPKEVRSGMPVVVSIEQVDDELKLPLFRPAA